MNDSPYYAHAVQLLRVLSEPAGIHASGTPTANYRAVFVRDAVMAGIAGLVVGDATITAAFVRTLEQVRALQGAEGQIASNYAVVPGAAPRVSFGTLAPRIDSATWYLVGVALAARAGAVSPSSFAESVRAVVRLLDAIEYNGRHLLYLPAGGNWADEYVTEGYILSDQVLRAWALRLLAPLCEMPECGEKARRIEARIEEEFWPSDSRRWHPIASYSPVAVRDVFDLAACALLGVSGVAHSIGERALDGIATEFLDRGDLPPAFHPVIAEGDPDWPALKRYQLHGFRNRPHEYHNGGIWPIWLGWLAVALARTGRATDLARLRALVRARLAAAPGFRFDEFLHGETGAPGGTSEMAYSATGLIFLAEADSPAAAQLFAP